ncbi:MAG TPA: lytic transglycosylase domain-containing protein, partial [Verrucomicrobiales bacterium]|nr:lytic transglycosylase domain-containing protein [Verrucomicrobiales bacterium]
REWAEAEKVSPFVHEHVSDIETNILAGSWYLAKLMKRYTKTDNPIPYALADYNAGRGNVLKWIRGKAATNSVEFLAEVGFPSTHQYIQDVIEKRNNLRAGKP